MYRRIAVAAMGGSIGAFGLVLIRHGLGEPGLMGNRHVVIGSTLAVCGLVVACGWWLYGRSQQIRDAYVMGYRHGRRDANAQLLEDGLWLADRAEGSAHHKQPPKG